MTWLRRMLGRPKGPIVPNDPEQAKLLARADAILEDPRIRHILDERDRQLRGSALRANARLAR